MARVAVITAPNIGYRNTGMLTVDLAFDSLRRRMATAVEPTWYTLHPPETVPLRPYIHPTDLPFRFRPLAPHLAELDDHDAVVFWGDFLHTRHYLAQDATNRLLDFGMAEDRDGARALLERTLLLADQPESLLSRTLSYGGTILHNTQSDYEDKQYGPLFTRLMTRSHRVWMRDPLSAAKLAHLRGDFTTPHFASDAALLNHPADLNRLPATEWSREMPDDGAIGVFLGARTEIPEWLPAFCRALSDRLGAPLAWLPWFDREIPADFGPVARRPGTPTAGDLLQSLSRYRLVITDTYHLCVNAWGAGTPVVCVGAPQPAPTTDDDYLTLSDLKKHVFHLAYDATDFYLSTRPDTPEAHERRAAGIVRLVTGGAADAVGARTRRHASASEAAFTGALTSLLTGTG
ncbi:polysaccharide pyruvyl transferase family protein [Streptomyces sp. LP11]|uniref:Polysaccharide pyruvyl transferase family protein n=1 Tax=Streptomyces pyxinicus TaxID=2970331 RepID=A0ABT2BA22_9ACTN|nr:polysaccharide pyruvyl transferase family protein [Streptomyces sp. LP11]MCS0605364.1 polysaccharide pyruvyl transferase family protein [Streptomyces sp. LP11]